MRTICSKGHVLAEVGFYVTRSTGQIVCKPCRKAYSQARHDRMGDEIRAQRRTPSFRLSQREKRPGRYGMTIREYRTLFHEQQGLCAICEMPETALSNSGFLRPLSIDHDHFTGSVRGLLCNKCNRALGLLGDDLGMAEAVVAYLRTALKIELDHAS